MDSRAALLGLPFFGQPPVVRFGRLFLTKTASFTLALHWAARFPLRFPNPLE
jgi:hypothetical protein